LTDQSEEVFLRLDETVIALQSFGRFDGMSQHGFQAKEPRVFFEKASVGKFPDVEMEE
jgi:hypothetical protein